VRNLVNTVTAPTRITENTKLLIGVIVIKENHKNLAIVSDLGYSDHQGQMCINTENAKRGLLKVRERQFSEENIQGFKYL
jgi:hypothetical protein